MNINQRANIDTMVRAISESLFSAWSYLHLLQGLHQGGKAHPGVLQRFDRLFDQVWRAVFDGLFAKAGTLIDRKRSTQSLPNLFTLAHRYGGVELKHLVKELEARLNARAGPIAKIESWRHHVVAHRTPYGKRTAFYVDYKMSLEDISAGLSQLEELVNAVSVAVLRVHNDTEAGSADLVHQGAELFAYIAEKRSAPRKHKRPRIKQ